MSKKFISRDALALLNLLNRISNLLRSWAPTIFLTLAAKHYLYAADLSPTCITYPVASNISALPLIQSKNGVLYTEIGMYTSTDADNLEHFCYVTPDNLQSPVLRINPGDNLQIAFSNNLPNSNQTDMHVSNPFKVCGSAMMQADSTNLHYHGTDIKPVCHQDGAVYTLINHGALFLYNIKFPQNHFPGIYPYHAHVHGTAEKAVLGGASGAVIVEGIENYQPAVVDLPEKIFIVRDQLVVSNISDAITPAKDVSINYIPVLYPDYIPAVFPIKPREKQFWRVLNAAADTILNIQMQYDAITQPLEVVSIDSVPFENQKTKKLYNIQLGPMARAEFIITGPSSEVKDARFVTLNVDTGPDGDNDPFRPLLQLVADPDAPSGNRMPKASSQFIKNLNTASSLLAAKANAARDLYFSQDLADPNDPTSDEQYFITVQGQTPKLFETNDPAAIVTVQGSVEDWVIENRAAEAHVFHIHQLHFVPLEENGAALAPERKILMDTIVIPAYLGTGAYPRVKLRMDFRSPNIVGDFVYHCHILEHEDEGMMAKITVLAAPAQNRATSARGSLPLLPFVIAGAWLLGSGL